MCGRFTVKLTWEEIVRLYGLTAGTPAPHNLPPRYNVCPTDPIDTIVEQDGKRELVTMRWGLVPRWWSKTLKDVKMATFNARGRDRRDEAILSRSIQANAMPDPDV